MVKLYRVTKGSMNDKGGHKDEDHFQNRHRRHLGVGYRFDSLGSLQHIP